MAHYIQKDALVEEIERRMKNLTHEMSKFYYASNYNEWKFAVNEYKSLISLINALEVKEVDLEKEVTHYLLYEHRSPLNEIMHQADLNAEIQYHKDIENAFKAGFELGKAVNNKALKGE